MMTEEWRSVVGSEGFYEVSSAGRVRSIDRWIEYTNGQKRFYKGKILHPNLQSNGYFMVTIRAKSNSKPLNKTVHRLVAVAFLGDHAGLDVCHNDGDPSNNRLSNLRWDTRSMNNRDKRRHGTDHRVNQTHCVNGHEFVPENLVKARGRVCKACHRARCYRLDHPTADVRAYSDQAYEEITYTARLAQLIGGLS